MEPRYIAAIDLGSSKIALAIAKVSGENVEVLYYNVTPSDGIRYSTVFNPRKALTPLKKAIREAENQLKIRIRQAVIGLPRYSVIQQIANATLTRNTPNDYISTEEIEALKEMALQEYPLDNPEKQFIYGAVAQSFSTENDIQLSEADVVGTLCKEITGTFKIFIGDKDNVLALDKVFNDLGIAIAKEYFIPDVTAKAVLSEEEKENGVALVDFGEGVTSVTIYSKGIMRHYYSIPFGGGSVTQDIKSECTLSTSLAENIKMAWGVCMPDKLANLGEKIIQIRYDDGPYKEIPVKFISSIIDAREREIVDAILYSIQESNLRSDLRSGIVITGGGARMTNLANLIKEMSGYNVRIGVPRHRFTADGISGVFEPASVAAMGMLLAARDDRLPSCITTPASVPIPWLIEQPAVETPAAAYVPASEPETFTPEPEPAYEPEQAYEPEPAYEPEQAFDPYMKPEPQPEPEIAQEPVIETPVPRPAKRPVEKKPAETQQKQPKERKSFGELKWVKVLTNTYDKIGERIGKFADSLYEEVNS